MHHRNQPGSKCKSLAITKKRRTQPGFHVRTKLMICWWIDALQLKRHLAPLQKLKNIVRNQVHFPSVHQTCESTRHFNATWNLDRSSDDMKFSRNGSPWNFEESAIVKQNFEFACWIVKVAASSKQIASGSLFSMVLYTKRSIFLGATKMQNYFKFMRRKLLFFETYIFKFFLKSEYSI